MPDKLKQPYYDKMNRDVARYVRDLEIKESSKTSENSSIGDTIPDKQPKLLGKRPFVSQKFEMPKIREVKSIEIIDLEENNEIL